MDALTPTKAALVQHIRIAVYQGGQDATSLPGHANSWKQGMG